MVDARLLPLFHAVRDAGGRALVVGGTVRDSLLGHAGSDVDVEVHGLHTDDVSRLLRRWGRASEVGRSFGVFKTRIAGLPVDVSLPRRDSRRGPGHKGIHVEADPHLGIVEAARRRDLTINAIAWDPLTESFEDPFEGRADLAAGLLRAVDESTFGEDPLRALRVAQFVARFLFRVDERLTELCAAMPLAELPPERVRGEVEKLLLKGVSPELGWAFAVRARLWEKVIPAWRTCPPDLDRISREAIEPPPRRLALMVAAACDGLDPSAVVGVLDALRIHRTLGYRVRDQVLFLTQAREHAATFTDDDIRRAADHGELELLAALVGDSGLASRSAMLGVRSGPLPTLLAGPTLARMGVPSGPAMGAALRAVREAQLLGVIGTAEEAEIWLADRMRLGPIP